MIDEKMFAEWLDHPVTREVRKRFALKRADLRNEWELSEPASYSKDTFVLGNVANVGMCRGLLHAEQYDYQAYLTDIKAEDDDEPVRTGTEGSGSVA